LQHRYISIVEKRDRKTLLTIIQREVEPETTIHNDQRGVFATLNEHELTHKTVNHSQHFIRPSTGAHILNLSKLLVCREKMLRYKSK
jgi:hypothetical protein